MGPFNKLEEYVGKPVTRIAIWLVLLWLFVESTSAIGSWVWKVLLQWEC